MEWPSLLFPVGAVVCHCEHPVPHVLKAEGVVDQVFHEARTGWDSGVYVHLVSLSSRAMVGQG